VEAIDLERATGGARLQVGGREVEGVDVAAVEDDLREAALVGPGGGLAEHAGAEVDAEDAAFGADAGGEAVEALAGAAGQVEDRLAGARTQDDRSCAPLLTVERLEAAVVERGEPVVPAHGCARVGRRAGMSKRPTRCCT
jgi:hypothetical protein